MFESSNHITLNSKLLACDIHSVYSWTSIFAGFADVLTSVPVDLRSSLAWVECQVWHQVIT